jgi:hypothetical protein
MTQTDPVIGNIITAISVIIAVIVTAAIEEIGKRGEFKRMIHHEAHQKRIALYEGIIEELLVMVEPKRELLSMSLVDFEDKTLEFQHRLVTFLGRLNIYGSPRSRNVIALLSSKLFIQHRNMPRKDSAENFDIIRFTREIIEESLVEFVTVIRKKIGIEFIDKEIMKNISGVKNK